MTVDARFHQSAVPSISRIVRSATHTADRMANVSQILRFTLLLNICGLSCPLVDQRTKLRKISGKDE